MQKYDVSSISVNSKRAQHSHTLHYLHQISILGQYKLSTFLSSNSLLASLWEGWNKSSALLEEVSWVIQLDSFHPVVHRSLSRISSSSWGVDTVCLSVVDYFSFPAPSRRFSLNVSLSFYPIHLFLSRYLTNFIALFMPCS